MSLRSSSQQPPGIICQQRSAPAVNRTRHVGSVTCARYCQAMSLETTLVNQLVTILKILETVFEKITLKVVYVRPVFLLTIHYTPC